jgi:hypothetical protein
MVVRQIPRISPSIRRDIYHDTLFNLQFSFLSFEFGFPMGGRSKVVATFSGWMDRRIALICLEEGRGRFLNGGLKRDDLT